MAKIESMRRVSSRTISCRFRKAGFGKSNDDDSDDDEGLSLCELVSRSWRGIHGKRRPQVFDRKKAFPPPEMDGNDIANTTLERSAESDKDEEPAIIKEERPSMGRLLEGDGSFASASDCW